MKSLGKLCGLAMAAAVAASVLVWAWQGWMQPPALLQLLSGFSLCG